MKRTDKIVKKLLASVLACTMIMGLCACDDEGYDEDWTEESVPDESVPDDEGGNGGVRSADVTAMQMSVNKETGEMTIVRPKFAGEPMGESGTWTIFVYLCGTDLESGGGAGVTDIAEMASATENSNYKFIVQTGGTNQWNYNGIDADKIERFVVENGDITKVYEGGDLAMGDSSTLADYLVWGVQNYPADNMGLILWNHGGGSITGVCFDERHGSDALSLREVDSALLTAQQYMTDKWEFIGFDACLMGSIEAANILANYANYMYGSEEIEPGAGWNYTEIGNFLANNPGASGADLGKVVCDSFYQGCIDIGDYNVCTLSVIDLSKIDQVVMSFNDFSKDVYEKGEDADSLSTMIRQIESTEIFGSSVSEGGCFNMLDVCALAESCGDYSSNAAAVRSAVDDAVLYKIHGPDHPNSCGLSLYFPVMLGGSEELKVFSDICVSPYFMQFIDRRDFSASIYYGDSGAQTAEQGADYYQDSETGVSYVTENNEYYAYDQKNNVYYHYNASTEKWEEVSGSGLNADQYNYSCSNQVCSNYSDDEYYDDSGCWNWNNNYEYDSTSRSYRSAPTQTNRYDYADTIEKTGESKHIKFLRAPSTDEEGIFRFTLTKYSLDHCSDVYAMVFMLVDENEVILLGDTYDVECDWENGSFADMFDGYWLSLPDGQNLSMTILDKNDEFVIFTSPVMLNGEETYLRIRMNIEDGSIEIEGACDGMTETGAASKNITKLKDGDKIIPLYTSFTLDDDMTESLYMGDEFTVSGEVELVYGLLFEGDFMYTFIIEDIYRDYLMTDFTAFNVDENGDVWFYEEVEE